MHSSVLATASLEEILDDLSRYTCLIYIYLLLFLGYTLNLSSFSSRFIINVVDEELQSFERIAFQVEQAHWFYEDFVRLLQPNLPSFQLKTFSEKNILFSFLF